MGSGQCKIGREMYTYQLVGPCEVCDSFRRDEVDAQLSAGRTPAELVTDWAHGVGPTLAELQQHCARGHVPVDRPPARIMGLVAGKVAIPTRSRGGAAAPAGDVVGFAETVISAVTDKIAAGEVQPSMRDAVAAANLLARLDATGEPVGYIQESTVTSVMGAWLNAARAVMSRDQMQTFGRALDEHPLLRELHQRDQGRHRR